jgi:putative Holliday junction resolvase
VTESPETLLAFDYGEKHIGVAVGQTLTGTANPLETIRVTRTSPDWNAISRIVRTWRPNSTKMPKTMKSMGVTDDSI